jgi:hypothetical protein
MSIVSNWMPSAPQLLDQRQEVLDGTPERLDLGDLRADVRVHAADVDARHARRRPVEVRRLLGRDAELGGGVPGPGVRMRGGRLDVGVDPERDRHGAPRRHPQLVQGVQLPLGLHVEAVDSGAVRVGELVHRLPHAAEDDAIGRDAGAERTVQLAGGDDVGSRPHSGQGAEHGQVAVRLDRVGDQEVQPGECVAQPPETLLDGGLAVQVERRAPASCRLRDRYVVAVQLAVPCDEVMVHPQYAFAQTASRLAGSPLTMHRSGASAEANSSSGIRRMVAPVSSFTRASTSSVPFQPA